MIISEKKIQSYKKNGFLVIDDFLSANEIAILKNESKRLLNQNIFNKILEKNGDVRIFFSPHTDSEIFAKLAQLPRLVEPAKQLLGSDIYIHQSKIHPKVALHGEQWEWHQDFWYWHKEDGLPTPRILSVVIFLDDVNDFNSPILVIPGSHKQVIQLGINHKSLRSNKVEQFWLDSVLNADKYKMDKNTLAKIAEEKGIVAIKGSAGFAMFFDACIIHCSGANMSPWDRYSVFVTYNSIENTLIEIDNPRPEFLAQRDFTPVKTLSDNALLEMSSFINYD
ncbi:phytanoyl-CoA dioxygenase family protein [Coleofasciculus sp. E2-BRE-01]|uniref:phytanoyl-CoA dioxygenase family protein n=1 Tax=Coleofasciculus sp. E2-BRE-01 TaxID=3069524 RepID=UPI0032FF6942